MFLTLFLIGSRFCKATINDPQTKDPCTSNPCHNGGSSELAGLNYSCVCAPAFSGANCETEVGCENRKLNILIIMDVSNSIGNISFTKMKSFQNQMLDSFEIGPYATNIALMTFSVDPKVVFKLNEYNDNKSAVLAAVATQGYETGATTRLGEAIKLAVSEVFARKNGDRPEVDNCVFVFTDGFNDADDDVTVAVNIGHLQAKAKVFVITLHGNVNTSTVNTIASDPGYEYAFRVDSQNATNAITDLVSVCEILVGV